MCSHVEMCGDLNDTPPNLVIKSIQYNSHIHVTYLTSISDVDVLNFENRQVAWMLYSQNMYVS